MAAVAVLGVGAAGAAYAVGGGSEEQVTGPDAEQASQAALDAVGGGTVTEVEYQDSDGAGTYEVEVEQADGSQVEVHLDDAFQEVGAAADDDTGEGPEGDDDGEGAG